MLGFIRTDADVGYYNAAVKIKTILVSIVTSLGVVLLPRASYYVEHSMMDEFYRITKKAINFVFLIATPMMIYFMLFAKEGVFFLSGDAYAGAIIPMQVIMPTLLFIGLTNIMGIQMLVPLGGYTKMIANLLDEIEVRLSTDYLENKAELDALADKVVYTGPIDAYFDYKLGTLEYRSVRFETETLDKPNFQGNAAVNYTDRETPWTRIIEHKWFEFGKDENGNDLPKTIISREYSSEWKPGDEPYYPVNDAKNGLLYSEYKKLADAENNVIFGGRLGEYKYYDMDQVIAAVLDRCEKEF